MPSPEQHSTTPILDLVESLTQPRAPRNRQNAIVLLTAIAAALFRSYPVLALISGYFAISLVAIAIHELGHCLAGRIAGLRLEKLIVGPFSIRRGTDHWNLQVRQHLLGGLTYMSVQRIGQMRRSLSFYYAGGPLASLVIGAFALFACRAERIGGNPALGLSMAAFAILSLMYGVQGLRPLRYGAYSSDGMLLRAILRSYEGAKQQLAAHAIQMMRIRGVDRSQWNRRWIRVASNITKVQQQKYYSDWLAYESALDVRSAGEALELCLAGSARLGPEEREEVIDELLLEAATFHAWNRGDADKAEVWFNRALHPERAWTLTRIRAGVAMHYAHHRLIAAFADWERGLEFIHRLPLSYRTTQIESHWLEWRILLENGESEQQATKASVSLSQTHKFVYPLG